MKNISRSLLLSCLFPVLIALGILVFRLGALPFIGPDEPRYARIAEEMLNSGNWVTPRLENHPWLEKPPLYYWMTIPFYSMFGIGEFTARIGTVLAVLIAAFALFWLGSRLWSRLAGLLAASIFMTSLGTVAFGRSASTDMPLTACLTVALTLFGAAASAEKFEAWKIWTAWAFVGLGILAKGPVGFILPAGIGLMFWLFDEKGGSLRRWRIGPGILVSLAVSVPWFLLAFRENGFAFITVFFINHNLTRYISDIHHHTEGVYYYVPVMLGLLFPWTAWLLPLLPASVRASARRWREWDGPTLFLSCWVLFPFLFFSASRSKLPGYILPCLPPLALLIGRQFAGWIESGKPFRRSIGTAWLHLVLSAALATAFPLVMYRSYGGSWKEGVPVSAACVILAWTGFRAALKADGNRAFQAVLSQCVMVVLALTQFCFPVLGRYNSAKDIGLQTRQIRMGEEAVISYGFFHHALHYYSGYIIDEDLNDPIALGTFASSHSKFLVVTQASREREIQHLTGFSIVRLGEQGKLRLLRLNRL